MNTAKPLAAAFATLTLALGGVVFTAGSAGATYSDCRDYIAAYVEDGSTPPQRAVSYACSVAAKGDVAKCEKELSVRTEHTEPVPEESAKKACEAGVSQPPR